jgi:hypothetical protein
MAKAGRILIIPKGEYNAEYSYKMLDLVTHNGGTWLAKKDAIGVEPSDENGDTWFKFVGINIDIANNLETTEEGYALDARQGKALMQAISDTNTRIEDLAELINTGGGGGGSSNDDVPISMAEYEDLSDEEKASDTSYYVYDLEADGDASTTPYDNRKSGLQAKNVQSAIDEINSNLSKQNKTWRKILDCVSTYNVTHTFESIADCSEVMFLIENDNYVNTGFSVVIPKDAYDKTSKRIQCMQTLSNASYVGYDVETRNDTSMTFTNSNSSALATVYVR